MRPLLPSDTVPVWVAYRMLAHGPDLTDDQATDWALPAFDEMLWRRRAAQFIVGSDGEQLPDALGRLVEIDFRHRSARAEYWCLTSDPSRSNSFAVVKALLDHAFGQLGLHRVTMLVPAYLDGPDYERAARHFEDEGTHRDHVFRRGHWWDVRAFGRLATDG